MICFCYKFVKYRCIIFVNVCICDNVVFIYWKGGKEGDECLGYLMEVILLILVVVLLLFFVLIFLRRLISNLGDVIIIMKL